MRRLHTLLALCVVGSAAGGLQAPPTLARTGGFTVSPCPFKIGAGLVQGKDVRCGTVAVPEDHNQPNGKTIQIPVAIFVSHSAKRKPDPVFSLQGGPGGAWISILAPSIDTSSLSNFVGDRDLVIIDQRGTGYAKPSLACTPAALKNADPIKHTTPEQDVVQSLIVAKQCTAEIKGRGIDLHVYTSSQDAADIESVRAALGYNSINLYGVSYGSELVQVIMRAYPAHIRSAILDSVVPLTNSLFVDGITNPDRGIKQVFKGCAADPSCNNAFPGLQATFNDTVRRLDAHPVVIRALDISTGKQMKDPYSGKPARGLLTGQVFQSLIAQAEYESALIPYLPLTIAATSNGKYTLDELFAGDSLATEKIVTTAMYYSVTCSEDAPFTTSAQITSAANKLDQQFRHDQVTGSLGELALCRDWPVNAVPTSFKQPIHSSIPTLLLEGAYDPITPEANAKGVAAGLSTSYLYTFPGFGHGELFSGPCPTSIMQSFLSNPKAQPDNRCRASLTPPKFVLPNN